MGTSSTATMPAPALAPEERLIDRFIPIADVRELHEIVVRAPADVVYDVARNMDMQASPLVRAIFWLREKLMRAAPTGARRPRGLVEETQALGWGVLSERPGRELVMGAVTRPWLSNPVFEAVPAQRFLGFSEPDQVKIAWTLEAESRGPALTRFRTETRVLATDAAARAKFRRYWRWAGFGIVFIRLLLLPGVRREAERRWQTRAAQTA